jgi:hypothetical protein
MLKNRLQYELSKRSERLHTIRTDTMNALPHNIEKSAFHRGEYVGYAACSVWRIERSTSSFGRWAARCDSPIADIVTRNLTIFAWTLDDMSAKLVAASKDWDARRAA